VDQKADQARGNALKPETESQKQSKEGKACTYCDQPTTEVQGKQNSRERDHIIAKSKGGNNSPENEADVCRGCNRQKSARPLTDWIRERIEPLKNEERP
jgi:5-methylcytosine-specific restriction endonuclease McrA